MTQVKTLPKDSWELLKQAPDGIQLDPENSEAIVAIDDGKLVGRMYLCVMPHIEGTWIEEKHRGGTLLVRLETELLRKARELGIKGILAFATDESHISYLRRRGYRKFPVTVWSKEL